MVLAGTFSVQAGSALATTLFDNLGPAGTVWLRTLFGALILVAIWRPAVRVVASVRILNVTVSRYGPPFALSQ